MDFCITDSKKKKNLEQLMSHPKVLDMIDEPQKFKYGCFWNHTLYFLPSFETCEPLWFHASRNKSNSGRWSEDLVILHNRVKIQTADEREL